MNTFDQTFQIVQKTVCSAWVKGIGGEDRLTDRLQRRTQNGCEVWPETLSCDGWAVTSDWPKVAGRLLAAAAASAAAHNAPWGSGTNCHTSCTTTILCKGQVSQLAGKKQMFWLTEFKLHLESTQSNTQVHNTDGRRTYRSCTSAVVQVVQLSAS